MARIREWLIQSSNDSYYTPPTFFQYLLQSEKKIENISYYGIDPSEENFFKSLKEKENKFPGLWSYKFIKYEKYADFGDPNYDPKKEEELIKAFQEYKKLKEKYYNPIYSYPGERERVLTKENVEGTEMEYFLEVDKDSSTI